MCIRDSLCIDLIIIFPLTITMSNARANDKLSQNPPAGSLLTIPILLSILGQIILQAILQISLAVTTNTQPWRDDFSQEQLGKYGAEVNEKNPPYPEQNVLFLFSNFLYIIVLIAFYIGKPYREPFHKNIPYTVNIVLITIVLFIITLNIDFVNRFFEQSDINNDMFWLVLDFTIIALIAILVFERVVLRQTVALVKRSYTKDQEKKAALEDKEAKEAKFKRASQELNQTPGVI
eukprot:TRINITY_DN3246_c0_g1_i1.p1 TRINITY_DN3246_c0_g1~~TRINITY_DN3246_c0_g1_i1.p1  ORF type:complete len:234 (-),score=78.43 TRINITY_DN3246_c0_g1_i1:195-896(-)